jgi:uncharacterized protein DUF2848
VHFRVEPDGDDLSFEPEIVVAAGYTGRDQASVKAHVAELAAQGVKPPTSVPSWFVVPPALLTQDAEILVTHERTSGEAEVVFLVGPEGTFVAPASDHTDREAEKLDVQVSKVACPKVVGRSVWRLDDLASRWDRIGLVASAGDGDLSLYQQASLGDLLAPRDLLAAIPWRSPAKRYALLSGTVPTIGGIRFTPRFRVELRDPAGASLALEYRTRVQPFMPIAG